MQGSLNMFFTSGRTSPASNDSRIFFSSTDPTDSSDPISFLWKRIKIQNWETQKTEYSISGCLDFCFFCATILLDELENNHNLQVDWVVLEHPVPRRLCRKPLQNIVKVAIFLVWPSSKVPGVKPVVTVRRGVFVWVEPAVFAASMGGGVAVGVVT